MTGQCLVDAVAGDPRTDRHFDADIDDFVTSQSNFAMIMRASGRTVKPPWFMSGSEGMHGRAETLASRLLEMTTSAGERPECLLGTVPCDPFGRGAGSVCLVLTGSAHVVTFFLRVVCSDLILRVS